MAKDDPRQLLTDAAETLRARGRARIVDARHAGQQTRVVAEQCAKTIYEVADALDPLPEPKPEIPPGELVVDNDGWLLGTSVDGPHYLTNYSPAGMGKSNSLTLATVEHVACFTKRRPGHVASMLQHLARLVVSQEQPPELTGDDQEKWVVVEKRIAQCGESYVGPLSKIICTAPRASALHLWIVKPKE